MKRSIESPLAPKAIGPYSQAVVMGDLLFCSGQIPMNPETGTLVSNDPESQARQIMDNLSHVLSAAGLTFDDALKATIYVTDLGHFDAINRVYQEYFQPPYPARAMVEVSALPKGSLLEIELIAAARKA